jgi:hypothetical protein
MKQHITNIFKFILSVALLCLSAYEIAAQTLPNRYREPIFGVTEMNNVRFATNIPKVRTTPKLSAPFFSLTASIIAPNEADMTSQTQNLDMDIFLPAGDTFTKRPVIILCFGGGFVGGNRNQADLKDLYARELAKRGFVTAMIDYRLGMNLFNQNAAFRGVYRAIQDGRQAVRFFRANAATYGIDPDQIYIGGHSAGGFVALHNIHMDKVSEIPPQVQAVPTGTYGNTSAWPNLGGLDGIGANQTFDGKANLAFAFAGAIGFLSYIEGPDDVPMLQFHSEDDGTVQFGVGVPFPGLAALTDLPTVYGGGATHPYALSVNAPSILYDTIDLGHNPHVGNASNQDLTRDRISTFMYNERLKPESVEIDGDAVICLSPVSDNNLRTYTLSNNDNLHYDWEISGGEFVSMPDINSTSVTVRWTNGGSHYIRVWTYSQNLARSESPITLNVAITIENTVSTAVGSPKFCVGQTLDAITHTTTGATGIGTPTGLPNGVTATWAGNVITITGVPTENAPAFEYSIPLIGGCGDIFATGTIVGDITAPMVTCNPFTITFNGENSIDLIAMDLATFSDDCAISSVTLSPSSTFCSQVFSSVPVLVTVTDSGGNVNTCISNVSPVGLPCNWVQSANGVNCNGGSSVVFNPMNNTFNVQSVNCASTNFGADVLAFAQQTLCGNGSITAKVENLIGSGWAGVTMRENNNTGAKKAAIMINGSNFARRIFRTLTNASATPQQIMNANRNWVRVTRSGNQFSLHTSADGFNWFFVGAQNIVMDNCIEVGLVATNFNSNSTVNALFSNVFINGGFVTLGSDDIEHLTNDQRTSISADIYPNPTNGQLFVRLNDELTASEIQIITLDGRIIHRQPAIYNGDSTMMLDLSGQQPGLYMVKIIQSDGSQSMKRVVLTQ